MKTHHILIVDDEERIGILLKKFFEKNGFLVSVASEAKEAISLMDRFIFDMIILDVMMPHISGLELSKMIKSGKYKVPVILLTALSEHENRVKGLKSGADDYISKPFSTQELIIRVKNLINLYSSKNNNDSYLYFGDCKYDKNTKRLIKNDSEVSLTNIELRMLEKLIENANIAVSREYLSSSSVALRSIDVTIKRLRDKIEIDPTNPKIISTVRNNGYMFKVICESNN